MVEPMNPAVNPAATITRVRIISYLQFDGEVWTTATGLRRDRRSRRGEITVHGRPDFPGPVQSILDRR
jgi:hypothetical protein